MGTYDDILKPQAGTYDDILSGVKPKKPWEDVVIDSIGNVPKDAIQYGSDMVSAIASPIDTAKGLLTLGQGAAVNVMPDAYIKWLDRVQPSVASHRAKVSDVASAVGQQYKADYGSVEGFKNKLSEHPVQVLGDLSMVLSGGAGLAGKVPMLAKPAQLLSKAASATNPLNIAAKPVKMAGDLTANVVSAFGTHTGSMPIKQAFKSGLEGGESSKLFRQNMRGDVPAADVLDAAKANLAAMGAAKSAEYRAGMAQVSGDRTILSFTGIDDAVQGAKRTVSFNGQIKNMKAAKAVQAIEQEVAKWKKLDPARFHTPEGLDVLKQKIGAIIEDLPYEQKTARMAANGVYHSIKGEIVSQAPVYAKTMKSYTDAMDEIKEVERTLSLGNKPSVDTAMRKLQSLTRNNVNTNYGNRLGLAETLEQRGGRQLMPALAGQALNNFAPRGLGGTVAGGVGMGGYAMGGADAAAWLMSLQSPRLVGEVAYKLGQAGRIPAIPLRYMKGKGLDPATIANILAQLPKQNQ